MNILNKIIDFLADKLTYIMAWFPTSPFQRSLSYASSLPYLGYVNWFIPIGWIIDVTAAWCTIIGIYYLYSIIARWVKAIE